MAETVCVLLQLTGTLSDNVGMATLDKKHQEQRQQIMTTHFDGGRTQHFRAGLRSLMHGVVGGVVSVPQQAIVGARDEGLVVCYIPLSLQWQEFIVIYLKTATRNLHCHFQEETENFLLFSGIWLHMILFYFISPVTIVMHLRSFSSGGSTKFFNLNLNLNLTSFYIARARSTRVQLYMIWVYYWLWLRNSCAGQPVMLFYSWYFLVFLFLFHCLVSDIVWSVVTKRCHLFSCGLDL